MAQSSIPPDVSGNLRLGLETNSKNRWNLILELHLVASQGEQ